MSGTTGRATPCRLAVSQLLDDGEWHSLEEVLAVGAAKVDDERADREMANKSSRSPRSEEDRRKIGRRNVANHAVGAMIRFGQAKKVTQDGVKGVIKVQSGAHSLGELGETVSSLVSRVEDLELQVEALTAFRDHVEQREVADPAEQRFFDAATTG